MTEKLECSVCDYNNYQKKKRAWGACEILRKDQWNVRNVALLWRPKIIFSKCVTVQIF